MTFRSSVSNPLVTALLDRQTASTKGLSAAPTPNLSEASLTSLRELLRNKFNGALNEDTQEILDRLFTFGLGVPKSRAAEAFDPMEVEALIEQGLLQEGKDRIYSQFTAQEYDGLICFSDFVREKIPADYVLPIGPSGQFLAALTIREPVGSALDIGCGCGIQSLLLARHARHVTATDINPRCLALTLLNARLNGVDNIELLQGSYFEPVQGRRFDLIVSNTPYVITPQKTYTYRDAEGVGDSTILHLIKSVPDFLNEGGYAHILAIWLHKKKQSWVEPIRQLVTSRQVDAFMTHSYSDTPSQYADDWIYDDIKKDRLRFLWTKLKWVLWYWRMGMERFAFGSVTMRRRTTAANWLRTEQTGEIAGRSAGGHIHSIFLAEDYLFTHSDPTTLLEEILQPAQLKIKVNESGEVRRVSMENSLVLPCKISPFVGQVLHHSNGSNTLRQAIEKAESEQIESPEPQPLVLDAIRNLIRLGYVTYSI